ncbi:MAG: diadenylate cyclase CdaA [Armatimonadota bacterium]
MLDFNIFSNLPWADILRNAVDILLVAVLFYYLLLLIRGTRAVQILQGIGILLFLMLASSYFKLDTVYWILEKALLAAAVALPIVFQPELRRALEHIGRRGGVFRTSIYKLDKEVLAKLIDELTWAVYILSQNRMGSLIIIEKATGLQDFIETGIKIDADVSAKLLLSIFVTQSPLHDGAVIIRAGKVAAASCYLPLSEEVSAMKEKMGARHRAALGITEEADAIAIVVSEETGGVSIVRGGKMTRNLNTENFKKMLKSYLSPGLARPAKIFKGFDLKNVFTIFKKKH